MLEPGVLMRSLPGLLLSLCSSLQLFAQTPRFNELPGEVFREFQFNFATPGARASGMGRAFIGLADDATASVSNPAGLVNLDKPQVYSEFKSTQLRSRRLAERGALNTLQTSNFYSRLNDLSFLNVSFPLGDRLVIALTRHEFLNFTEEFVLGDRAIPGDCRDLNENGRFEVGSSGECVPLLFPVRGQGDDPARTHFEGVSVAGSIAFQIRQRISIGATVSLEKLHADVDVSNFAGFANALRDSDTHDALLDSNNELLNRTPNGTPIDPNLTIARYTVDDSDKAIGFTLGLLYTPIKDLSIGTVFTKGASFKLMQSRAFSQEFIEFAEAAGAVIGSLLFTQEFSFDIPDRYGFGLAARPSDRTRIVFDLLRIKYSDFLRDDTVITPESNFVGDGATPGFGFSPSRAAAAAFPVDYEIDDATELHLGGEFELPMRRLQLFTRVGIFNDPDHRIRFVGSPFNPLLNRRIFIGNESVGEVNFSFFNLQQRNDRVGWTLGFGAYARRAQADLAYVSIDSFDEFVFSIAVRF